MFRICGTLCRAFHRAFCAPQVVSIAPQGADRRFGGRQAVDQLLVPLEIPLYFTSLRETNEGMSTLPEENRHNFTNYADNRFGALLVTNDYGIVGGRDTEDDDSYRYRIHLKLVSQAGSNENALRFALLQVPGIPDVVFDSKAGTLICYVYAITPVAAASVLAAVQDTIDQTVAFPVTGLAVNPDLVGITFATTITLVSGTTATDCGTVISRRPAAAQTYSNNLGVGNALILKDMATEIQQLPGQDPGCRPAQPPDPGFCSINLKEYPYDLV